MREMAADESSPGPESETSQFVLTTPQVSPTLRGSFVRRRNRRGFIQQLGHKLVEEQTILCRKS